MRRCPAARATSESEMRLQAFHAAAGFSSLERYFRNWQFKAANLIGSPLAEVYELEINYTKTIIAVS